MPIDPARWTRRAFLGAGVAVAAAGWLARRARGGPEAIPGAIVGPSPSAGHLLREDKEFTPDEESFRETVIVGAGIAGLSAAWWLKRNGYDRFSLLELESEVGGNSRAGANAVSAYPWGAHYVPLPGEEATLVRLLFEELGVIRGYDAQQRPIYDEFHLCADPHERLFIQGRWQEGLVPALGLSVDEQREINEFFAAVAQFSVRRGRDGRRAFAIPMELSSRDPELLALDGITMEAYMRARGWNSAPLHWYVRYCCRDDYGAGHDRVSAWAGMHYFAARTGTAANAESQSVLTWPAGNGWLVERLRERFPKNIRTGTLVAAVKREGEGASVDFRDVATGKVSRLHARQVIFAAPRFVAARVIRPHAGESVPIAAGARYAPWLVANVTLATLPKGTGAPLSWDNVSYYDQSLGYVVATHQNLSAPRETVITYFRPLDEVEPVAARKSALQMSHEAWSEVITRDLERMHPGIRPTISRLDVCVWGHGMIGPPVGFLWGRERRRLARSFGPIHFAHSDMSGLSLFEEAQYRGVQAAKRVLKEVGRG